MCSLLVPLILAGCAGSDKESDPGSNSSTSSSSTTLVGQQTTTTSLPGTSTSIETTTTLGTRAATAEETAPMEAFINAYVSQDGAAIESVFAGQPEVEFKIVGGNTATWTLALMLKDAAFSAAVLDDWQLDRCTYTYGRVSCRVTVQDELGRRRGLNPVVLTFLYTVQGDQWTDVVWNAFDAFRGFDVEMHTYGDWYEAEYPDRDPIQGDHYRAWHVDDPTAGNRFMESLDDYMANSG